MLLGRFVVIPLVLFKVFNETVAKLYPLGLIVLGFILNVIIIQFVGVYELVFEVL